jgi:hypothetical protein
MRRGSPSESHTLFRPHDDGERVPAWQGQGDREHYLYRNNALLTPAGASGEVKLPHGFVCRGCIRAQGGLT